MLTFYRMLPDDVARAQFEQNVESLREAVQALLEHVGARLETLPHLWRACTVFRLALAEIGFDHDQLNSQAAVSPSTMIMEMNMRNCAPLQSPHKQPIAMLERCPFLHVLTEDIACGKQTLIELQCGVDEDCGLFDSLTDMILFLQDCENFARTVLPTGG